MAPTSEGSKLLEAVLEPLDIPQALSIAAREEFRRIANWLGATGSPLAEFNRDLYPQGSFRLGTPVHPISSADEFDIDLVCELGIEKQDVTQKELKALVGDRLKADTAGAGVLRERRRCWTLSYKGQFHLDVLPTIPDPGHATRGVLLTDRELRHWQHSNPVGYAEWFFSRTTTQLLAERDALAKSTKVDIEDVPEWGVRTPLQRAVQLLKRHRDVHFRSDVENRPASIVITTLSGRQYNGQADLRTAAVEILDGMEGHIEDRSGDWWIVNPAHPQENFADKWNERPALRDAFLRWRERAYEDLDSLFHLGSIRDAATLLEKSFAASIDARDNVFKSFVPSTVSNAIPDTGVLAHRKPLAWPVHAEYECSVDARSSRPTGAGRWRLLSPGEPKTASFKFVARTNAPPPFEVFWQITNSGEEARLAGQLRGGFERGEGATGVVRHETASYRGTHIVQAFVVKQGAVVATSREVRVRIR